MHHYADHFGELRQLLSSDPRNLDADPGFLGPSSQDGSSLSSWSGFDAPRPSARMPSTRPPRATAYPLATRVRGASAAPQAPAPLPSARDAAGWSEVHRYLAQRQAGGAIPDVPPLPAAPAPLALPHGEPVERRAKRGKPMARRSLQKLFDAAADEESTWPSAGSIDIDDDVTDTASGSATSSQTDCAFPSSFGTPLGTPGALGMASRPETPSSAAPAASTIPLLHLLTSARGQRLTLAEAKAILLRVAEDLKEQHACGIVNRQVDLSEVVLTFHDDFATASLPVGKSAARLGSSSCLYGPRERGSEAYTAPEAARCPATRTVHTLQTDMWAYGALCFALLSGGTLPFGGQGICAQSSASCLFQTVDALQEWLHAQLTSKVEAMNELSEAQAACVGAPEMRVLGFDAGAVSLLLGLLRADPAQRLSAADVVEHAWLAEVAPMVPRMRASTLVPGIEEESGSDDSSAAQAPVPTLSDVLKRTEKLAFATPGEVKAGGSDGTTLGGAECPYPVIGHVAQPLEVCVDGQMMVVSALHAVYAVPGHGAMMSATPVAVAPYDGTATDATGDNKPTPTANCMDARGPRPLFMPLLDS